MDKELKKTRNLLNKIVKNFGRNDLDWVAQLSITSVRPDKINYCAQIEAPANGLQPLTWVKDSWKELQESLELAEKGLDQKAVDKAWHESEIQRAEALIKYHKESIEELEKVTES